MKKFVVIIGLVIAIFMVVEMPSAEASGVYDGIWLIKYKGTDIGYASIHENGQQLVFVTLTPDTDWEALYGTRVDNKATLSTIIAKVNASIAIVFSSSTELSFTQTSCTPKEESCNFPKGASFSAVKLF